jgi:hypothetical protein
MTRRLLILGGIVALAVTASGQSVSLRISGPRSVTLSAADVAGMAHIKVTASSHDQEATYEGVPMRELLTRAGVPAGEALRGQDLATAVVVTGADGYRVAFGVAEFDPAFTDRVAILADKKNGKALGETEAPFQLILTGEKRPSRWVRQVISIEIQKAVASR